MLFSQFCTVKICETQKLNLVFVCRAGTNIQEEENSAASTMLNDPVLSHSRHPELQNNDVISSFHTILFIYLSIYL